MTVALISVINKKNLKKICNALKKYNIKIIATNNTYQEIKKLGYNAIKIKDVTKFNEILDGRVKTIHPVIHGGILYRREDTKDLKTIKEKKIPPIDFVIINMYDFKKIVDQKKSDDECIENIDIGGHTLIRSAAKNYKYVTVICDPQDYLIFIKEMKKFNGKTSLRFRKMLSKKAFEMIYRYDKNISYWFNKNLLKKEINYKTVTLKYGENPHQNSNLYLNKKYLGPLNCTQLNKKVLSYNNINDANAALLCISNFQKKPTSVIVKHKNPCGVASSNNIIDAFKKSICCDPISAFGGIIAVNRKINEKFAKKLNNFKIDIIIAPQFTQKSLNILKNKKKLIILKSNKYKYESKLSETKNVIGGYVKQDSDNIIINKKFFKCVTKNKVGKKILDDMIFAFTISKYVNSNAVVIVKNQQILGIGAGQTNRLESIKIAIKKMKKHFPNSKNYVLASDGFLPFIDNIKILKNNYCKAIIQPGGSINDAKIINIANLLNISMYFTGIRHFSH